MKRIFLLCFSVLSLVSCSLDTDDNDVFYYEFMPITSVDMPEIFELGRVYDIHLKYLRPSTCYNYYDLYYMVDTNQRTIAIVNSVYPNMGCQTLEDEEVEVRFDFLASQRGSYVFKFWQGKDENDNDLYYIVEVPVLE
ncbi:MAG TPA: hypothetical protein PKL92_02580 [Aquaticitalea sp.]|nr:hypothetical protein [Aquaticitalea sp.]